MDTKNLLNENQQRRLLAKAKHADHLLGEIEQILVASESKSAFPKYNPDVTPYEARLIRSYVERFRDHLGRALDAVGVRHEGARFGSLHSIRVTLGFVRIVVEEMGPESFRGSGELKEEAAVELRGLCAELEALLTTLERHLDLGEETDLQDLRGRGD